MTLPILPFKFAKTYGVSGARAHIYTASESTRPGFINVTWSGNGVHPVTLSYTVAESEMFLETGGWALLTDKPAVIPEEVDEEEPEEVETPVAVVYTGSTADLKAAWKTTIHGDGGECPVCERFGKVYNRTINDTMARSLQWLADEATDKGLRTWIDVPNTAPVFVLRSNQLSTLRWWGLVERQLPDSASKSKHSGMWRITLKGMDFVEGSTQVPKKVFTYNGEVVSYSTETTDFQSCKGKLFDYQKVMSSTSTKLGKSLFPANDEHSQAA